MATLFVYDEYSGRFITADPALMGRCKSCGGTLWTDGRFLYACRRLCSRYDMILKSSFHTLREPFAPFSPCFAGLSGDFALLCPCKNICGVQNEIRRYCINHKLFSYVEAQYQSPLWIRGEVSLGRSSLAVGYPVLFPGNMGVHVFVLQQGLNLLGFPCLMSGSLSGDTLPALSAFRLKHHLPQMEAVDAALWRALFAAMKKGCISAD